MAVLIWAVMFAIGCGCIAKEKGRGAGEWAILGFLFGLIALLVIICLPDKK